MAKTNFKKDKYSKARGNYSRWLLVSCEYCKSPVLLYQKDGPGILKRLYIDRVFAPDRLSELKNEINIDNIKSLICSRCKEVIAVPTVYEKERRLAYRLFAGAIEKKVVRKDINIEWRTI